MTKDSGKRHCSPRQAAIVAWAGLGLALAAMAPTALAAKNVRFFQSPSKNIGCVMARGQFSQARCDIRHRDWKPPRKPHSCHLDWGNGVQVGAQGKGRYTCAGDTVLGQGHVLAYGKSIRYGRFTCKSKTTGVKCHNRRTSHGFKLSRQRVRLF